MSHTEFQTRPIRSIYPNPDNPRVHSKKQIRQIAAAIKQLGLINPFVVNGNGMILAGNGRYVAVQELGIDNVPVAVVSGLTKAEEQLYILADNQLNNNSAWDPAALATAIHVMTPLLIEEGLSIELAGFETAKIDSLLSDHIDDESDPADEVPIVADKAVTRSGDLWKLERHRLLCGDATAEIDLQRLMGRDRASAIITDPPYNVRVASIQGRGKIKHREFPVASGEMTPHGFTHFLTNFMLLAAEYSNDGSIHYVFIDWKHLSEMLAAGAIAYGELKNIVVWCKSNAGMGSFYRSQHELICVFKNGDGAHQNNVELGKHGRHRSNVWTYAGVNSFRAGRLEELSIHPTVKPVALIADAMRDCSRRGEIILDPFMGSGTSILAAEKVGRRAYGLEIDPLYVDVAVKRWQDFTRRDAILKATGQTFDEVAAERTNPQKNRRIK